MIRLRYIQNQLEGTISHNVETEERGDNVMKKFYVIPPGKGFIDQKLRHWVDQNYK